MKINPDTKQEIKKLIQRKIEQEKERVTVYSAIELSQQEKKEVTSKLSLTGVSEISYILDPKLIAGIVVHKGSKILDLSLAGKLQNLHHLIYDNT